MEGGDNNPQANIRKYYKQTKGAIPPQGTVFELIFIYFLALQETLVAKNNFVLLWQYDNNLINKNFDDVCLKLPDENKCFYFSLKYCTDSNKCDLTLSGIKFPVKYFFGPLLCADDNWESNYVLFTNRKPTKYITNRFLSGQETSISSELKYLKYPEIYKIDGNKTSVITAIRDFLTDLDPGIQNINIDNRAHEQLQSLLANQAFFALNQYNIKELKIQIQGLLKTKYGEFLWSTPYDKMKRKIEECCYEAREINNYLVNSWIKKKKFNGCVSTRTMPYSFQSENLAGEANELFN